MSNLINIVQTLAEIIWKLADINRKIRDIVMINAKITKFSLKFTILLFLNRVFYTFFQFITAKTLLFPNYYCKFSSLFLLKISLNCFYDNLEIGFFQFIFENEVYVIIKNKLIGSSSSNKKRLE